MQTIPDDLKDRLRERIGNGRHPALNQAITQIEQQLGYSFPDDLRQIYKLADGGWGPGDGMMPLAEALANYLDLRSKPFGPLDQPWPEDLFPMYEEDRVPVSYNLTNGAIVAWEADRIEDLESHAEFEASFVEEAGSLSELLSSWLEAETFEQMRERTWRETMAKMDERPRSPVTGTIIMYDDIKEQIAAEIKLITEAEGLREIYGLPETGWEDEIRRLHGFKSD